jgi:hypothetical protein
MQAKDDRPLAPRDTPKAVYDAERHREILKCITDGTLSQADHERIITLELADRRRHFF